MTSRSLQVPLSLLLFSLSFPECAMGDVSDQGACLADGSRGACDDVQVGDANADGSAPRGESAASILETVGTRAIVSRTPFFKPETSQAIVDFPAEPGDVMIVTYPKCGTTWCQQLCHQLRTGGHTEFEEISEERIVPWLEIAPSLGIDISLPQIAAPRLFKTHQSLSAISSLEARGAKYLCVLRDPEAVLVSEFKFFLSKGFPGTESKDVNVYAVNNFLPSVAGGSSEFPPIFGGYIWEYYVEFWRCRGFPHVKLIAFEHLKRDLSAQIPVIADFMGISEVSADLNAKVSELGSFAWMQANGHLFDDHHMSVRKRKIDRAGKGDDDSEGEGSNRSLITKKVGLQVPKDVNTKMSEETRALLKRAWREVVTPITGHETYQAMIDDLLQ